VDTHDASKQLEALGNPTRLAICQLLVKAGRNGVNVGEINEVLTIPPSTLSHHIAKLVNAGLVSQRRKGRELICHPEPGAMDELVLYLADNCCGEDSEIWG
ncbi:MAG: metalloregulator ArsR/SmtB family transcription factor, partial [Xanthomonadales bacterium]|nr:metalloregulator ArsR/SmtB family transcription factor [Xanthomonadales bacterium]